MNDVRKLRNTHKNREKVRVETLEISANEPCPRGIVGQLLEIAKENDAMSEIGGATSWRWQEGIISRMPKTKTVAKILTKAFGTDNPSYWLKNTDGDLNLFIKRAFESSYSKVLEIEPSNIFEAVILLSLIDGVGATLDELIYRLCFFKYAQSFEEDEYFTEINESLIVKLNRDWATSFVDEYLKRYHIPTSSIGNYRLPDSYNYPHSKLIRYQQELMTLRHKVVTNNSSFDMWRVKTVSLTDIEMIEIEYKIIDYFNHLTMEILERTSNQNRDLVSLKTRLFSFNSVTMPKSEGEELKWKN